MLVYSEQTNHVHIHYIIMELFDRTWSASDVFRNEYFGTEDEAYSAIIQRGDDTRIYSLVPTIAVYRMDFTEDYS